MKYTTLIFLSAILIMNTSCGSKNKNGNVEVSGTASDEMKFKHYMIAGEQLYKKHCSNCHQENGEGLASLFPPLAKSDYLLQDVNRSVCIVRNGLKGEITVNGKKFNQPMSALGYLSDMEIAEVLTYVYNSWGNEKGLVTQQAVSDALLECEE
ncbi:c-type cytochrome [Marinigracilibium pacificum]|uniref:Cytochrome c n=1 Tax=Marinigracilibium pacificum TaxID=2729599 RepID=A0A848IZ14_9BACT|nr:cytochrome c [Marinigracilibium pacificum]NMM49517.1 cytochrome c [Marinigracilibium pacificum]